MPGSKGNSAFLQPSRQALQTPPQREAGTAMYALLQFVGKGSDHQMQFAPSKPQLVRRRGRPAPARGPALSVADGDCRADYRGALVGPAVLWRDHAGTRFLT